MIAATKRITSVQSQIKRQHRRDGANLSKLLYVERLREIFIVMAYRSDRDALNSKKLSGQLPVVEMKRRSANSIRACKFDLYKGRIYNCSLTCVKEYEISWQTGDVHI